MREDLVPVQLPNGQVIYFPQGTPQEEMIAASQDFLSQSASDEKEESFKDVASDYVKALSSGVGRGLEFMTSIPDYAASGVSMAIEKPMSFLGLERMTEEEREKIPKYFRPTDPSVISDFAEKITGGGIRYEPKTRGSKIVQAAGEGLPFGALGGLRAALVEGAIPSAASEYAGQLFEGSALEPVARIVAGLGAPTAIEGGARLFKTGGLNVPSPVSPERVKVSEELAEKGILETVGQIADDPVIMAREAATSIGRDLNEKQLEAFTSEVLKTAGINAKRSNPDVLDKQYINLGNMFNEISDQASIQITQELAESFNAPINDFVNNLFFTTVPKSVKDLADEFTALQASGRKITGDEYSNISRGLRKLKQAVDPSLKKLGKDLDEVLHNALGESFKASDNLDALNKWSKIKNQYRNLDTISRASVLSSAEAMSGLIRPTAIFNAQKSKSTVPSMARGKEDLAELARLGRRIRPLPQSGTAPRGIADSTIAGAASAIPTTMGVGLATGGDLLTTLGAGGTAGVLTGLAASRNQAMNNLISTQGGQDFLRKYLMGRGRPLLSPLPAGGLLTDYSQN